MGPGGGWSGETLDMLLFGAFPSLVPGLPSIRFEIIRSCVHSGTYNELPVIVRGSRAKVVDFGKSKNFYTFRTGI